MQNPSKQEPEQTNLCGISQSELGTGSLNLNCERAGGMKETMQTVSKQQTEPSKMGAGTKQNTM